MLKHPFLKIAAAVVGVFLLSLLLVQKTDIGGYGAPQKASYDMVGTASSFATTVTTTYSNTSTIFAGNLENLHLDVAYTPSVTNQYIQLQIEGSNDGGTTFFPITSKVVATTEIDIYAEDASGNAVGVPVVFPGDKTSTSATTYYGGFDFDMVADAVRVRAKDIGNSTSTLYIRGTVTTK